MFLRPGTVAFKFQYANPCAGLASSGWRSSFCRRGDCGASRGSDYSFAEERRKVHCNQGRWCLFMPRSDINFTGPWESRVHELPNHVGALQNSAKIPALNNRSKLCRPCPDLFWASSAPDKAGGIQFGQQNGQRHRIQSERCIDPAHDVGDPAIALALNREVRPIARVRFHRWQCRPCPGRPFSTLKVRRNGIRLTSPLASQTIDE
jgi:hypothetical protein